jgi:hypothetical protein
MVVAMVVLASPVASAHYISGDSVDGGEIRYGDETQTP